MAKGNGKSGGVGGSGGVTGGGNGGYAAYVAASTNAGKFLGGSAENLKAIRDYTGSKYLHVNELLRGGTAKFEAKHGEAKTAEVRTLAQAMISAVSAASRSGNVYRGVVMRGQTMSPKQIQAIAKSRTFATQSLTSTTVSRRIAKAFTGNVTLHIKQSKGVPVASVSRVKREKEVIIGVGQKFRVTRIRKSGKVTHIYMKE